MQIAVFVRLRLEGHLRRPLVFFVDCPDEMKRGLQTRLPGIAASNPYAWHAALVNETKQLYDRSIWALRDLVRDIELVSLPQTSIWQQANAGSNAMHHGTSPPCTTSDDTSSTRMRRWPSRQTPSRAS